MIYIGIDPGVNGGIAILGETGAIETVRSMPPTERDIVAYLGGHLSWIDGRAVLERASASPQMGVVSAFTFGRGYGALRMALTTMTVPFDEVTPKRWQRAMGCLTKGDKNVTKRRAQQLFPRIRVTHAIADALLIAEYCRRLDRGDFAQPGRRKGHQDGKAKARTDTGQGEAASKAAAPPADRQPHATTGREKSQGADARRPARHREAPKARPNPARPAVARDGRRPHS